MRGENTITPVFELKNIDYCYDHKKILENINVRINKSEFLAIVGLNSAGKSTLPELILGLLPSQSDKTFVEGIDSKNEKTLIKLSYVSQRANAFSSDFPAGARKVVLSGLTKTKRLFQAFNNKDNGKVIKILERLNIDDLIHKSIAELSSDQQQRVITARALISEPAVLVLDELASGIDAKHVNEFYNALDQLKQEGITIILVIHDIGIVADTATEVAYLNKHLHFHGTIDGFKSLNEAEISKIYGHPICFVDHQYNQECCN